jgi:hypothetical protein
MRKWLVILGVIIGGVILGVIGLMILLFSGPEIEVKNGTDLDEYAIKYLKDHNLIQEEEVVLLYYDHTVMHDGTEAIILTNKRIIYHCNNSICEGIAYERPQKMPTDSILLRNIVDIRHRIGTLVNDGFIGDIIRIVPDEGEEMLVKIHGGARGPSFVQTLITTWKLAK